MRYLKPALFAALLAATSGCSAVMTQQAKSVSSGYIGCAPDNVAISEFQWSGVTGKTWVATCNGQRLRCFERNGGDGTSTSHCAPESQAAH